MPKKDLFPALKSNNVGNKIKVMKNKEKDDIRFIDINEIHPSKLNRYPIEDIEKLAESIERNGLIHNLLLSKLNDESEYKFEILSGERRYAAIKYLIENGSKQFEDGIRAKVIDSSDDIEKEILLIEANEEVRNDDPARRRQMILRLEELYKLKAEKDGSDLRTISKDIANQVGIGERQVQRYRAVNTLIPELAEAFDNGNLNLEKAASISKLSEETQQVIASMLGEYKNTEIDLLKKEADRIVKEKENETNELRLKLEKLTKEYEVEKKNLQDQIDSLDNAINNNAEEKIKIREEIAKEIAANNKTKIDDLNKQLLENENERKDLLAIKNKTEIEKKEYDKKLKDKDNEINKLKDQIKSSDTQTRTLTKEEQKQLKMKFELQNITSDIRKAINNYLIKCDTYVQFYKEDAEISSSKEELIKFISSKLLNS